ncbi:DUF6682 family protein [Sphingobium cupriresistens]|uniref:phage adaptor protein n=1 Tax=Sphingobium cupriresistens TaxID=1132417 RepID=UPI003BAE11C0
MKAYEIMDRAQRLIQDATNVRWPLVELLIWLNDAQREIVLQKPSALSVSRVLALQTGTWQKLPDDALSLLKIIRNVTAVSGEGARTGGRAIRIISRDILDSQQPDWHTSDSTHFSAIVKHYIYDEEDTKSFYVFPGNAGTGKVEAVLSVEPSPIVIAEDDEPESIESYDIEIGLPAIYGNAILDYVCYRCYSKDAQYTGNMQRAVAHYQQFANSLGIKVNQEALNSPNADAGIKTAPTITA